MTTATAKRFDINQYGLTEVYRCPEPQVPQVDIVFVHGLNGASYSTWATKKPEVFWPGDLLPRTLKGLNVRILTYGYDANVASFAKGTSRERLHNHAEHLAAQLLANRNLQRALERPIIFVCHSLGGIVVKRTLLHCEHLRHPKTQHIRSTYVSTYAILFMGTPHNGSDLANLGTSIQSIFNLVPKKFFDTTPNLLKTLRPDNEILQNVNRQFAEIMGRFRIYFFHESKPMDLKGTRRFIVEESSAAPIIEGVERMGIEADHSAMCRFETAKSPGYEAVAEAILRYATEAPAEIASRWVQEHRARRNNMRDEAERLRNSLSSLHAGQNSEFLALTKSQLMSSAELPPPQLNGDPLLVAPPGFHPNWVFFGMEKELEELHNRLFRVRRRAEDVVSVLIYGGSGSGKSHLARQYVFNHRAAYTGGIFWIDARSRESCCQCFWDIAERLSATQEKESQDPDWHDRDKYIGKVLRWFASKQNWLVIFDGLSCDDDNEINEFKKFIPYNTNSSIIYTSVDRTLRKKQRLFEPFGLKVRPLSVENARNLLFKDLGIKQPTSEQMRKATELVEHFECLPLAIHAIGHRLSATGKSLEKYRIKPQTTDKRLAEPYRGIMADLQNNDHLEAVNLITILSFFGHDVPVGMIYLGRKALADCGVEIRSLEEDGNHGRHIDNTFAILIRYGLIDRLLDPYVSVERGPTTRRSTELSDNQPFSELESSQASGSQNTSSLTANSSIDVVKIHTVVQAFFRDELLRLGVGAFAWWLVVATRLLCLSYTNAISRIKTQNSPGLVKDFGEYETHASVLLGHFKQLRPYKGNPDLPPDMNSLSHALVQVRKDISEEIKHRSPETSQEFIKQQKSIFDRSSSISSMADTPNSASSLFSWEMDVDQDNAHSPIEFLSSRPLLQQFSSDHLPLPPAEDPGDESELEDSRTAPAMSPILSQTTEVPESTATEQDEDGWKVVAKASKPKDCRLFGIVTRRLGIRRVRGERNLGSYRPVDPVVSVSCVHGQGSSSRPQDIPGPNHDSAKSDAEASLAAVHHASPPPCRGGGVRNINPKLTKKENYPTYANVLAGKRPNATSSSTHSSPSLGWGSENNKPAEDHALIRPGSFPSQGGWSHRSSSDKLTNSYLSELGMGSTLKSPDNDRGPTPPLRFHSRHPSRSSEGSSGHILGLHDPVPQQYLAATGSPPLPYDNDITITRPRYTSFVIPPHDTHGPGVAPNYNNGIQVAPTWQQMPGGYSSQPMSRNISAQSDQSLYTEPARIPPKYSPGPGKRGSSPLPNFARTKAPGIDTRSPQIMFGRGGGIAITSPPTTPTSFDAAMMSRASSGPGMMVDSGDGMTRSFVEFSHHPATQYIRFGEHEPISVVEARMRSGRFARQFNPGQSIESTRTNFSGSTPPPYPSQNLMPSASDDDHLKWMIRNPLDNIENLQHNPRFRSGSSPARPNIDGYPRRQ
ncbi:LipA and NB-ARC domain-containing protein [Paracoccidioides lutzii Pb01]|uniref:LipA and NB-ARC domain-containing protein n=1 Tax=Paracoccidioides lutzii (strain ATCC MYA-826 / Pb01) TaxID=502779 RepID=C1GTY0_PARBA|nr:LipA and NB-ARC domain-containing protein [Paracoccidioides lutzii Pb01]EEH39786.2 LipA and NB-ARC domain-containing protein [Paracoccidioides lutzii Pb01]